MYQNMSFHNKVDVSYHKQFFNIFHYILLKYKEWFEFDEIWNWDDVCFNVLYTLVSAILKKHYRDQYSYS